MSQDVTKGIGGARLSRHFRFFYNFWPYKARRRLDFFSFVFLFFCLVCTSGVGFFVFFGGMENKFGLLHIFRMFDLVLPEHCEFLLFIDI